MPFVPGQSGNPSGRKAGEPNRMTQSVRAQIAAGVDPIDFLQRMVSGSAIAQADGQDAIPTLDHRLRAAMALANKLAPDARDSPIRFRGPPIDGLPSALGAMGAVTTGMAKGDLSPSEAGAILSVIGQYAKAYETTELERRISALETARRSEGRAA